MFDSSTPRARSTAPRAAGGFSFASTRAMPTSAGTQFSSSFSAS